MSHPAVGLLRLAFETVQLPDQEHQRLVMHLPAGAAPSTAAGRLAGPQPGGLRSVGAG